MINNISMNEILHFLVQCIFAIPFIIILLIGANIIKDIFIELISNRKDNH